MSATCKACSWPAPLRSCDCDAHPQLSSTNIFAECEAPQQNFDFWPFRACLLRLLPGGGGDIPCGGKYESTNSGATKIVPLLKNERTNYVWFSPELAFTPAPPPPPYGPLASPALIVSSNSVSWHSCSSSCRERYPVPLAQARPWLSTGWSGTFGTTVFAVPDVRMQPNDVCFDVILSHS